jgi:hypothetical protein
MTMSVETRKVLDMLAEGKITADDAERLLDKLAATKEPAESSAPENQESSGCATPRKHLRILVNGEGKDVNVRVPLSFVRTGVGLMAVLPPRVADRLNDKGFDLSALKDLKGDELNEALNTLNINIDSSDGKHVRVFCE